MLLQNKQGVLTTKPFDVEALSFAGAEHVYHRLVCPDWVVVLPVVGDKVALVRQFRAGCLEAVLELPGGGVHPDELKDPTLAAVRELEEETGYGTSRILSLLSIYPNPAIQNNRVHMFLALDCTVKHPRHRFPDATENISVELCALSSLEEQVRFGLIHHALSALCIMLSLKYLNYEHVSRYSK